jgi:nucleotide-binding universal stress UspA family protein
VHGLERLLAGSTSAWLGAHAKCPVISVPGSWNRADDQRRVVVGTDSSPQARNALAFGFAEASRRRSPLMVVRVWEVPPRWYSDVPPLEDEKLEWSDAQRLSLAEDLAGWSDEFPDVPVSRVIENSSSAAQVLVNRSKGASLLVVGARGHGTLPGLGLGWISRTVLARAQVPVSIVHTRDAFPFAAEPLAPVVRAS